MQWDAATPERRPDSARGRELTTPQRGAMIADFQQAIQSGLRGAKAKVARAWRCKDRTLRRIYGMFALQASTASVIDLSRGKRSGRPSQLTAEKWADTLAAKSAKRRKTLRRWAFAAKVPLTTLWRWARLQKTVKKKRYIKPKLTEAHKAARVAFVLQHIDNINSKNPHFISMKNKVHGDEKWFRRLDDGQGIWLSPGEEMPAAPRVQHKSHIPKAMFLALSARPQPNFNFDGRLAIHCCTKLETAQRTTKNQTKGDDKEVDVPVTAEYYRDIMRTEILPAVRDHYPWESLGGGTLVIQHDGAKPHTGKGNSACWPDLIKEVCPGRKIRVVTQPAQSPDLNTLDMGFFNSLHRLADETDPDSLSDLLDAVEECYWSYPTETLEKVWQIQYDVFNCILRAEGDIDYDLNASRATKRQRARSAAGNGLVDFEALQKCLLKYP